MQYFCDTGILLRLVNRQAPLHDQIRQAIRILKARGDATVTSFQVVSKFWNVCTRPAEARGGFGLTLDEARRRLATVERIATVLPDSPQMFVRWKELVFAHGVKGVQVHDAKLAATMKVYGVTQLPTLNPSDFARYTDVRTMTPAQVIESNRSR